MSSLSELAYTWKVLRPKVAITVSALSFTSLLPSSIQAIGDNQKSATSHAAIAQDRVFITTSDVSEGGLLSIHHLESRYIPKHNVSRGMVKDPMVAMGRCAVRRVRKGEIISVKDLFTDSNLKKYERECLAFPKEYAGGRRRGLLVLKRNIKKEMRYRRRMSLLGGSAVSNFRLTE